VFTAVFGVRQSRRELAELEHRQELRQTSRKRHLVTLGRTAVVTDAFDHPALGKARDQLQRIEEERGRHAGAVAASDAELERVRRDRETKAKEYVETTMKTDAELAELAKKLEPLEKEAAGVKRRAQELRETVQRVDKKIADTEALMVSVKGEKMDKAAIQADIVTFRADKEAVLRDEPVIAAQLDGLNPRIAAIEASRAELQKKKVELQRAEDEDQRRTSELLAAIGAKRKVVERAAAEAEQARDTALLELGDRLYVDRPKSLSNLLSPVDQIDLELGESDRRIMELREILSNIDRWKFSRGLAMIIVTLAIAGCFVWWLVAMLS
jgi:chromosome segregation ATPase